jgi:cysteinyl-tRNA synthetase
VKLRLYNTLSRKVEIFEPIDPNNVRMYVCGPTVYDRAHLGNARPAVVFDTLYRVLHLLHTNVTYVRNITDIDDKIYDAAIRNGRTVNELTEQTAKWYHDDIASLNVLPVSVEPRATEHIKDIIEFIGELVAGGSAYVSDGHVYFDVNSFGSYGALSNKNVGELIRGARVDVSESKRNPLDFVLWKPIDERFNLGWESPWGVGRPGWHIECSAMSRKYLGDHFDIHGGGIDLVFPHHENEIAQSCALSKRNVMANYWIHNGHLNINGEKMSKSSGNFFTVHDLLQKYDGEVIRMALLMTHYSAPQNFSYDILEQAKNILDHWYSSVRAAPENQAAGLVEGLVPEVLEALLNDLNTPLAITILSGIKDKCDGRFVSTCRRLLGIMMKHPDEWFCDVTAEQKAWINSKISERAWAKKAGDYAKADEIRNELLERGIVIEDTKDGSIWKTKN